MTLRQFIIYSPVCAAIMAATIAISYYALNKNRSLMENWMLDPESVTGRGNYHLLITHGFIHANYLHLAFNMITLWFFGPVLEVTVGHPHFALIYFGSMAFSAMVTSYKRRFFGGFRSLGASGAIAGVLFSFILYAPTARLGLFFIPIYIPAWLFAVLFAGFSYYASRNRTAIIDHEGHLWGAISGAALTILMDPGVVGGFFSQLLGGA